LIEVWFYVLFDLTQHRSYRIRTPRSFSQLDTENKRIFNTALVCADCECHTVDTGRPSVSWVGERRVRGSFPGTNHVLETTPSDRQRRDWRCRGWPPPTWTRPTTQHLVPLQIDYYL